MRSIHCLNSFVGSLPPLPTVAGAVGPTGPVGLFSNKLRAIELPTPNPKPCFMLSNRVGACPSAGAGAGAGDFLITLIVFTFVLLLVLGIVSCLLSLACYTRIDFKWMDYRQRLRLLTKNLNRWVSST